MATEEPTHRSGRLLQEGRLVLPMDIDDMAEVTNRPARREVRTRVSEHGAAEGRGDGGHDGERSREEVHDLRLHANSRTREGHRA